jgi:hypothetical protein
MRARPRTERGYQSSDVPKSENITDDFAFSRDFCGREK